MISVPIMISTDSFQVNDWFLSAMIVTLLFMLIIMGPHRSAYIASFSSMFKFNNPDGDVSYPLLSSMGYVFVFILSCISVGIAVAVYSQDLMEEGSSPVFFLMWYSFAVVACFVIKLLLYTTVNKILYNKQIITVKPGRWNCFFVVTFSEAGLFILCFTILVLFLDLPLILLLVFAYLMRILVISGRIFKIKTALFKNKRSNLGFIVYLCAFEIAPIIVEFVLTSRLFGLI